jgi:hypothetical protein
VHSWKSFVTLLVALLAPVVALARAYQTFTVDVPFEFNIGDRKFKPGTYIFVILGPGLMAMENGKQQVITTLLTRDLRGADAAAQPHVYFDRKNKHNRLASIWMGNSTQGLEIVGEEVAMRQSPAPPPLIFPPEQVVDPIAKMPRALK